MLNLQRRTLLTSAAAALATASPFAWAAYPDKPSKSLCRGRPVAALTRSAAPWHSACLKHWARRWWLIARPALPGKSAPMRWPNLRLTVTRWHCGTAACDCSGSRRQVAV